MTVFADVTKAHVDTPTEKEVLSTPKHTKEVEEQLRSKHALRFELGEVRYLFDPLLLRTESINFEQLASSIASKYALSFKAPDIVKHAALQSSQNPMAPTPNDRLSEVFASSSGLTFLDGLLRYEDDGGKDIRRIIRKVNLHSQNLTVAVDGTTREAEFVALRVASDLVQAQGIEPAKEVFLNYKSGVQYKTTTTQALGFPVETLLAPLTRDFIRTEVEASVGWRMGNLPTAPREREKTKASFSVRCAFKSLSFAISVWDHESGRAYDDITLDLRITDRRWMGSDIVTITSQLAIDDHLQIVATLISKAKP